MADLSERTHAFLVMQGETLTVRTTQPPGPLLDVWPPSQAWPEGAWLAVPFEELDRVLAVHMAEANADGRNRRRAKKKKATLRVTTATEGKDQ